MTPINIATESSLIGKIVLLLFGLTILAACNNQEESSPTLTDSITQIKADTAIKKLKLASVGDFPVLCYDSNAIRTIFNSNPTPFKVVFKFNFADTEAYNPSLKFYTARNNGQFFGSSYDLIRTTFPLGSPASVLNLGNLELRRTDLNLIPGSGSHLKFYPRISASYPGNVTYLLRWGTCEETITFAQAQALVGVELNPSPPADPSN